MNEQKDVIAIEQRWNREMGLLHQLNALLLEKRYDETYVSTVEQTKACLARLTELTKGLPNREPYGENYSTALDGARAVLLSLEATLKLMETAKRSAHIAAADVGWARVSEEMARSR